MTPFRGLELSEEVLMEGGVFEGVVAAEDDAGDEIV